MAEILRRDDIHTNLLIYGSHECINDMVVKKLVSHHNARNIRELQHKDIVYRESKDFFIFEATGNENMLGCIKELISNHSVSSRRHKVVVLNIHNLHNIFFPFRILLERFFQTTQFICTTTNISKIEQPIRSRFFMIRQPHTEPMLRTVDVITGIRTRPSIAEIQALSIKLMDCGIADIIHSCLKVSPYKREYLDFSTGIEHMFVKGMLHDKRAVIELLLIELFYPSCRHIL